MFHQSTITVLIFYDSVFFFSFFLNLTIQFYPSQHLVHHQCPNDLVKQDVFKCDCRFHHICLISAGRSCLCPIFGKPFIRRLIQTLVTHENLDIVNNSIADLNHTVLFNIWFFTRKHGSASSEQKRKKKLASCSSEERTTVFFF